MRRDPTDILEELRSKAQKCSRCELCKTRTNLVFGVGPASAEVMLIGEAPGFWEDQAGVPFVGAAGKNLNALLQEAGLKREEVYITNVVKARPPGNRDPTEEEIAACRPFLQGQISAIRPKLVVALGRIAAGELLGRPVTMSREHGTLVDCSYAGVDFKLFLTYHPAAGIYSGRTKLELQDDFRRLGEMLKSLRSSRTTKQP
ncbi:MAG: uracil-DNA glycosylase [Candidatus Hadarchaeales archaeon]